MYIHGNRTCGKGGEGEFARTPVGTVPAEKGVRENLHVHPWKSYLRKRRRVQTRMYIHGNRTCGKGGEGEFACTPVGTVPAEKEVSANSHVHPWKPYLRKRGDGKTHVSLRKGRCKLEKMSIKTKSSM